MVDVIENNLLADDFVIIIDDYERQGERDTAAKVRGLLNDKKLAFSEGVYSGAKETIIICSEKYKFLTSL